MRPLTAMLAALVAAGCAGEGEGPGTCEPPAPAAMVEGALVLGLSASGGGSDSDGGGFRPLADGGAMELELGTQGGWMITPTLAVDRTMMASDGACVELAVEVDLGGGDPPARFEVIVPELGGSDDHLYSEPLPVFLSYDLEELEERAAIVSAVLADDEVAASVEVAVRLENSR